ncbi:hypothetical protein [Paenibacillus amylolyticus]|uniref:hypothetical protein n=1 Tax=Paenibacillus amylolyticus TaxID=1451 RepID=UPI003EB97E9D
MMTERSDKSDKSDKSYLLAAMHGLLGIGAVAGGLLLMIDPSGRLLNMPVTLLEKSPFSDFFIPGMILFMVLGICPIVICIALVRRVHWTLAKKLNLYPERYWALSIQMVTLLPDIQRRYTV